MGAIHTKIKKLRIQHGMTQQEMADKMNLSLKGWQKVENGATKLDIDRLQVIADILESSMEDLLNADDGMFINEIKGVGVNNSEVNINNRSEDEKDLYERLIAEKEKIIQAKDTEIALLRQLLDKAGARG